MTASPVFVLLSKEKMERNLGLGVLEWTGILVWVVGMSIEVVADRQKICFREVPGNRDKFINEGLWKYSRHPNYCG